VAAARRCVRADSPTQTHPSKTRRDENPPFLFKSQRSRSDLALPPSRPRQWLVASRTELPRTDSHSAAQGPPPRSARGPPPRSARHPPQARHRCVPFFFISASVARRFAP
jgi:hypothetical protein